MSIFAPVGMTVPRGCLQRAEERALNGQLDSDHVPEHGDAIQLAVDIGKQRGHADHDVAESDERSSPDHGDSPGGDALMEWAIVHAAAPAPVRRREPRYRVRCAASSRSSLARCTAEERSRTWSLA